MISDSKHYSGDEHLEDASVTAAPQTRKPPGSREFFLVECEHEGGRKTKMLYLSERTAREVAQRKAAAGLPVVLASDAGVRLLRTRSHRAEMMRGKHSHERSTWFRRHPRHGEAPYPWVIGVDVPGGCNFCDAIQSVTAIEEGISRIQVRHDDWCPIMATRGHSGRRR